MTDEELPVDEGVESEYSPGADADPDADESLESGEAYALPAIAPLQLPGLDGLELLMPSPYSTSGPGSG